jgi:hypothetical protein
LIAAEIEPAIDKANKRVKPNTPFAKAMGSKVGIPAPDEDEDDEEWEDEDEDVEERKSKPTPKASKMQQMIAASVKSVLAEALAPMATEIVRMRGDWDDLMGETPRRASKSAKTKVDRKRKDVAALLGQYENAPDESDEEAIGAKGMDGFMSQIFQAAEKELGGGKPNKASSEE